MVAHRTIGPCRPDPRPLDRPLRVLVVDADDRVRESLTGLLAIGGRVVVVGGAGLPGPALDLADRDRIPTSSSSIPACPRSTAGLAFIGGSARSCPASASWP